MKRLLVALGVHGLLLQATPVIWWVPDLTAAALVVSVGRVPKRWLAWSLAAAVWVIAWAPRSASAVALGYLALGAAVWAMGRQWNAADPRLQSLVAAAAAVILPAVWYPDPRDPASWWRMALLRGLITAASVWFLQGREARIAQGAGA